MSVKLSVRHGEIVAICEEQQKKKGDNTFHNYYLPRHNTVRVVHFFSDVACPTHL